MIVVSDTSPLNYLVLIDVIDVLPKLFGKVHVPPTVMLELQHPRTPQVVKRWAQRPPDWLHIQAPTTRAPAISELDAGETEAIALALELHAVAILIDERKGRQFAWKQGLATLRTITVLELASGRDLLDLQTCLRALQRTSFHISKDLIEAAVERDAVRKRKKQ